MVGRRNGSMKIDLEVLKVQLASMQKAIEDLDDSVKNHYVTQTEFAPIRNVVFAFLSFALLGLISAVGASVYYFIQSGG